ncbi:uncharacterized protein LOC128237919 [Mya arenaria]|uniref:uncharacterized protein LOC128237919 n=1 Tax=Mya arenaria TaxID=6604 RepID=UPI0022E24EA8|nr:uncharacterized protein LOC128237919 [Mya arenaria]
MYDQEAKRAILGARSEALLGAHSGALLGAHSGALLGAHSGAHLGAQSGAHSGALLGAHSGAHLGAQSGAHSGALLGAHSGAHLGAHSGAHLGTQLPPPQKAQPTPLITGTLTLCEKDSIQDKTAFMLPFTMIISGPKASGQEFKARKVQELMKKEEIHYFPTQNETKASTSERAILTRRPDSCATYRLAREQLQLFLNISGKTKVVRVNEGSTIEELFKECGKVSGIPKEEIRLIKGIHELRCNDSSGNITYLKNYGIDNESNLFLVMRLKGGSAAYGTDFKLTITEDSFYGDKDGPKTRMSCSHVVGPESLTNCVNSQLGDGKFELKCPLCNELWSNIEIRKKALLTKKDYSDMEQTISKNFINSKGSEIKQCPGCSTFCSRIGNHQRLHCRLCTSNKKTAFDFCWICLRTWKSTSSDGCGNFNCDKKTPVLQTLKECDRKIIVGVPNCPSIRACPKCGQLIEHTEACKHMACRCGQEFCFICLKMKDSSGKFQCGSYKTKCAVAPVQTTINE